MSDKSKATTTGRSSGVRLAAVFVLLFSQNSAVDGFSTPPIRASNVNLCTSAAARRTTATTASQQRLRAAKTSDDNFLMDAYRDPSTGEILDPYQVLKIQRRADRKEIKQAYRTLSRRYHPDVIRNRDILPGSCNTLEDVRNQWERVKLSYEILNDPTSRKRYDRNEAWADPGKAVQRAASQAAMDAVVSVSKGVWGLGASMLKEVAKEVAKSADQALASNKPPPASASGPALTPTASASVEIENDINTNTTHHIHAPVVPASALVTQRRVIQVPVRVDHDFVEREAKVQLEKAFRAHINHSLQKTRINTGPTIFQKREKKNRGLRSLYSLGMVPINRAA